MESRAPPMFPVDGNLCIEVESRIKDMIEEDRGGKMQDRWHLFNFRSNPDRAVAGYILAFRGGKRAQKAPSCSTPQNPGEQNKRIKNPQFPL